MKKALLAGLCFVLVGFALVNGTFAMPDWDKVFAYVKELGNDLGWPEWGGANTAVHVSLVSDDTQQWLYPGGAVSRTTRVRNEGTGSVYFRLVYAFQYDADSWDNLDIDFTTDGDYTVSDWKPIDIDGTPYQMKVLTYKAALPNGADSPAVTIAIAMDESITSEEISRLRSDFLQTQVLAIDPTPFTNQGYTTAEAALDLALPLATLNPF